MRHAPFCHIRSAAGLKHLIDTHRGAGALFWYWQARVHPAHGLSLSTHGAVSRLPGVEGTQAGILGGEEMLLECCLIVQRGGGEWSNLHPGQDCAVGKREAGDSMGGGKGAQYGRRGKEPGRKSSSNNEDDRVSRKMACCYHMTLSVCQDYRKVGCWGNQKVETIVCMIRVAVAVFGAVPGLPCLVQVQMGLAGQVFQE